MKVHRNCYACFHKKNLMVDLQVLYDFTNVTLAVPGFESGLHPIQHCAPFLALNDVYHVLWMR